MREGGSKGYQRKGVSVGQIGDNLSIKTGCNSNKFLTHLIVTGIHEFIPTYISKQVYK